MAKNRKQSRPRGTISPSASGSGPRRLGIDDSRPNSAGAARRAARRRGARRSSNTGWIAVGLVVVLVVVFVVIRVTGGSSPSSGSNSADRNPPAASPAEVTAVTTVPASAFNTIGTGGLTGDDVMTVMTKQPPLKVGNLPQFVYMGAEYCPYCAMMRWAIVASLARFGTWSGLKDTSSSNSDGNIPTFSFLGSHYKSKYFVFSGYEYEDRAEQPLQALPKSIAALATKYGYPPFTSTEAEGGIPFLDIANKYTSSGDPGVFQNLIPLLQNGGPGRIAVADAIHDPTSPTASAIQVKYIVGEANFLSAAVCSVDGMMPKAVCTSSAVHAAAVSLAQNTKVS